MRTNLAALGQSILHFIILPLICLLPVLAIVEMGKVSAHLPRGQVQLEGHLPEEGQEQDALWRIQRLLGEIFLLLLVVAELS